MRMVDLIEKKRDGGVLSDEEIRFIIDGFTKGEIPDYQMSAWAMAVFYKGMTDHETAVLTDGIAAQGALSCRHVLGEEVNKDLSGFVFRDFAFQTAIDKAASGMCSGIPRVHVGENGSILMDCDHRSFGNHIELRIGNDGRHFKDAVDLGL